MISISRGERIRSVSNARGKRRSERRAGYGMVIIRSISRGSRYV